jgi:dephospho-CoA kinase
VKLIGLTGGIGSGKSTVAQVLADLGATVIHADTVGHDVYRPRTEGWQQVTRAFGTAVLAADGTIDRRKLGAIVFANPQARERLNAIVHPLIAEEIRRQIEAYRAAGTTCVVVEAALLIEANWLALVDEVWLVVATKDAVIERVVTQRHLTREEVALRLDAQLSDAERRRFADRVIENTGAVQQLREGVSKAWTAATRADT